MYAVYFVLAYLLFKKTSKKFKVLSPTKARKLIDQDYFKTIIDVRSKKEYSQGHYPKASNLPYDQINNKFNNSKPVLIYCRSGRRAKIAAQYFNNVYLIEDTYKSLLKK